MQSINLGDQVCKFLLTMSETPLFWYIRTYTINKRITRLIKSSRKKQLYIHMHGQECHYIHEWWIV
jgi:hypothetical protein